MGVLVKVWVVSGRGQGEDQETQKYLCMWGV